MAFTAQTTGLSLPAVGGDVKVGMWRGLPKDVWATRLFWAVSILLWAVLLLSVVALNANAWFLIAVGTIGMIRNAFIAAAGRVPETRGLCLEQEVLIGKKNMDVLMDLETWESGCGRGVS